MRRIISLFLILEVLLSLQINILAVNTPEAPSIVEADYILYENNIISMIVTDMDDGQSLVAWLEKSDPTIVYQWVGILETTFTGNRTSPPFALSSAQMEDVEVFNVQYLDKQSVGLRSGREDDVIEIMEGLYGAPRTWRHVYTSPTYTSPLVKIREDDYVGAVELGLVALPKTISNSAAAIAIAERLGIPVPSALSIFSKAVKVYNALQTGYEMITLDAYRGSYVTERTGTVTPSNGSEIPVLTATKSSLRIVTFLDPLHNEYVIEDAEVIYTPSQTEYQYTQLSEDTYEAYVN